MKHIATTVILLLSVLTVSAQESVPQDVNPQDNPTQDSTIHTNFQTSATPQDTWLNQESLPASMQTSHYTNNNSVYVVKHGDAETIVNRNLKSNPKSVRGYRIVIFNKNAQSARQEALAIKEKFQGLFPDIPTYLDYPEPYFIVSVGNFSTIEEATVFLGRIQGDFPKANIVNENINIKEFAK